MMINDTGPTQGAVMQRRLVDEAMRRARYQLRRGDLHQAEAALRDALAIDREQAQCHAALGLVLLRLGRPAEAERAFSRAIACEPEDEALHRSRGTALESMGRLSQAADEYAAALLLDPNSAMARAALGSALLRQGNLEAGAEHLRQAAIMDPADPLTLTELARASRQFGDGEGARRHAMAAIDVLGDPARPAVLRRGALLARGDLQELRAQLLPWLGARGSAAGTHLAAEPQRAGSGGPGRPIPGPARVGPRRPQLPPSRPQPTSTPAVGVPLQMLEAEVCAAPDDCRLRHALSMAYLRAGRLGDAREQTLVIEEQLRHRRRRSLVTSSCLPHTPSPA